MSAQWRKLSKRFNWRVLMEIGKNNTLLLYLRLIFLRSETDYFSFSFLGNGNTLFWLQFLFVIGEKGFVMPLETKSLFFSAYNRVGSCITFATCNTRKKLRTMDHLGGSFKILYVVILKIRMTKFCRYPVSLLQIILRTTTGKQQLPIIETHCARYCRFADAYSADNQHR